MERAYLGFGLGLCLLFAYAAYTGWSVWDTVTAGEWSPQGQQDVSHK